MRIMKWNERYKEYLTDESGLRGACEEIIFPSSSDELRDCLKLDLQFTIQGSRTGIMGGASPMGDGSDSRKAAILNLSRLQNIAEVTIQNNISYIRADAGAALEDIQARLRKKHLFFPVEPTENTATIGGAFACNAKGLTSLKYGSCNDHVEGIELLTADGNLLTIPRGNYFFEEDGCPLPDGGFLSCRPLPCKKERIPLLPYKGMDLIDLFAGSEGTLGILLSLNLRVIPIPPACWSLIFFFSDEKEALAFAGKLKTLPAGAGEILCAEFFDPLSLSLSREAKEEQTSLAPRPDPPSGATCAILLEAASHSEEAMEEFLFSLLEISEQSDEERTWASDSAIDKERFRSMRHCVPEKINQHIHAAQNKDPRIHKLALDLSGPPDQYEDYYDLYQKTLCECEVRGTICGHILENRLHVNFLPKDYGEFERAADAASRLSDEIIKLGGCPCAENGIGKIKRPLLKKYLTAKEQALQQTIKDFFDPHHKLGAGNIL